ncbi:NAD(P)-dependent alcohol dehydrogenase [soil metagenome]
MTAIRAYAPTGPKSELKSFTYEPGLLKPHDVEIAVQSCGVCHSDLSMINNEWGMSQYPFVPGHEVVGTVAAIGDQVTNRKVGDTVGLGWYSQSCMQCRPCMGGDHNLCGSVESTIVGRNGGFADRVRAHSAWTIPLPAGLDVSKAGPLFCGGITVFNPLLQFDVRPTHRVGVVGIGGLGHMALMFLNKWGCEVIAFTSESKKEEALKLGAHEAVSSRDTGTFTKLAGSLDFLLVTANVPLDWPAYLNCLAPKGRLHFVGAVPAPVPVAVFPLMTKQNEISASPLGSPNTTATMLDFCARHKIAPVTETFPMSEINKAIKHLESGNARYRIVLQNDFK